jgi:hypothetical protein
MSQTPSLILKDYSNPRNFRQKNINERTDFIRSQKRKRETKSVQEQESNVPIISGMSLMKGKKKEEEVEEAIRRNILRKRMNMTEEEKNEEGIAEVFEFNRLSDELEMKRIKLKGLIKNESKFYNFLEGNGLKFFHSENNKEESSSPDISIIDIIEKEKHRENKRKLDKIELTEKIQELVNQQNKILKYVGEKEIVRNVFLLRHLPLKEWTKKELMVGRYTLKQANIRRNSNDNVYRENNELIEKIEKELKNRKI